MRRLSLNRSEPATKSGQNIPKSRCRTTIAERMVETLAELPFIGDQVGCLSHNGGVRIAGRRSRLAVIWDWRQQLYLFAMYLLLALPFFAPASAIGLSLAARPIRIGAIYRADLTGAGAGALGIVLAMFAFPPEDCLRVIAAVALVAAAIALASD